MTAGLIDWLASHGISIAPHIELVDDAGFLKVVACTNIPEGAVLCVIPKAAILSKRTTGIADLFESGDEALRIDGGLALLAAVLHELSLCDKSPWWVLACVRWAAYAMPQTQMRRRP